MFGSTLAAQPNLLPTPLIYAPPVFPQGLQEMRVKDMYHDSCAPYVFPPNNRFRRRALKKTKKINNVNKVGSDSNSLNIQNDTGTINESCNSLLTNNQKLDELKVPSEMTKPLYCELCCAKLNGSLQASAHYEGKNHAKKVRQYLDHLRQTKGIQDAIPIPSDKSKVKDKKNSKPLEVYCKLCDVAFTSDIQAKQHYNGRNHQRRLRGEPPLPKGFFNPLTGKWQRQPPVGVPYYIPTQQKKPQKYSCDLCNVSMTSQEQYNSHLYGAKHRSKVAAQNNPVSLAFPTVETNDDCP
ncbi:zinc finger matrin-type protein 3-like isoform X2 [Centruroides sculpturatus]|uniref:zinc finger matrin-type protein 3-like isoform X2 n=1 Tax=Centruroides sculpturatus TaxID=218467 RepID=UPI000C6DA89C|nr:zinc finger matrin-type protein 3-like isoform X2 [Centruroides sculpturatus]